MDRELDDDDCLLVVKALAREIKESERRVSQKLRKGGYRDSDMDTLRDRIHGMKILKRRLEATLP